MKIVSQNKLVTSCRAVVSGNRRYGVVSDRAGENGKSKQAVCFDSKPILFVVATICRSNRIFILCPILSKLKLGLELKQKFALKQPFLNNPTQLCKCKKNIISRLWNLRGWYGLVVRVLASCFNSQFFRFQTSYKAIVSELKVWDVVTLKAGENCKSKQAGNQL